LSAERDAIELAEENLRYAAGNFYVTDTPYRRRSSVNSNGGRRSIGNENDKARFDCGT